MIRMAKYINNSGCRVFFTVRTSHDTVDVYDVAPGGTADGPLSYQDAFCREGLTFVEEIDAPVAAANEPLSHCPNCGYKVVIHGLRPEVIAHGAAQVAQGAPAAELRQPVDDTSKVEFVEKFVASEKAAEAAKVDSFSDVEINPEPATEPVPQPPLNAAAPPLPKAPAKKGR